MIARPVHRPRPIPFDAPSPAPTSTQTRAVSWASALGPGAPAPAGIQHGARLSPVKVSLSAAPSPLHGSQHANGHSGHSGLHPHHPQAAKRPTLSAVQAGANRPVGGATHDVGGPRHHQAGQAGSNAMTEVSARYIGHGALSVRSSVTGRHYRFQGHGDSLVIDRNDVVLLKRIQDLVIR